MSDPIIPPVVSWTNEDCARMLADAQRLRQERLDQYLRACCPPGATMTTAPLPLIRGGQGHPDAEVESTGAVVGLVLIGLLAFAAGLLLGWAL